MVGTLVNIGRSTTMSKAVITPAMTSRLMFLGLDGLGLMPLYFAPMQYSALSLRRKS